MNYHSLAERAYFELENLIVTLALEPGEIYSESELGGKINIGRTPLREALLRLANEKLVKVVPRRGIVITNINIGDYFTLLDTRSVLDKLIAQAAAKKASTEQKEQLNALADKIKRLAEQNQIAEYMDIDKEFDLLVAAAAKNKFASEAAMPLHAHCRRFWFYFHHNDLVTPARHHATLMRTIALGKEDQAGLDSDKLIEYLKEIARASIEG
ncbi:MAG: GntR family transcriptional regulator [Exilibacterium sp.]